MIVGYLDLDPITTSIHTHLGLASLRNPSETLVPSSWYEVQWPPHANGSNSIFA